MPIPAVVRLARRLFERDLTLFLYFTGVCLTLSACTACMCWHCVCTVQTCFGHCLHVRLCGGTSSVQHAFGAVSAQVCACVFNSVSVWLRVWFTFCAGVCMHVMAVYAYE